MNHNIEPILKDVCDDTVFAAKFVTPESDFLLSEEWELYDKTKIRVEAWYSPNWNFGGVDVKPRFGSYVVASRESRADVVALYDAIQDGITWKRMQEEMGFTS